MGRNDKYGGKAPASIASEVLKRNAINAKSVAQEFNPGIPSLVGFHTGLPVAYETANRAVMTISNPNEVKNAVRDRFSLGDQIGGGKRKSSIRAGKFGINATITDPNALNKSSIVSPNHLQYASLMPGKFNARGSLISGSSSSAKTTKKQQQGKGVSIPKNPFPSVSEKKMSRKK